MAYRLLRYEGMHSAPAGKTEYAHTNLTINGGQEKATR